MDSEREEWLINAVFAAIGTTDALAAADFDSFVDTLAKTLKVSPGEIEHALVYVIEYMRKELEEREAINARRAQLQTLFEL